MSQFVYTDSWCQWSAMIYDCGICWAYTFHLMRKGTLLACDLWSFKCACAAIQWGRIPGSLSEASAADAQARLSLRCSPMWQVPFSHELAHLFSTLILVLLLYEPLHDKTNKMTCAPSKDSDQPGHLIRVFAVRLKKHWVLNYLLSAQWKLWSDWADAQADLSLSCAHMLFCWFCHAAAHIVTTAVQQTLLNYTGKSRNVWRFRP